VTRGDARYVKKKGIEKGGCKDQKRMYPYLCAKRVGNGTTAEIEKSKERKYRRGPWKEETVTMTVAGIAS
jgi:hypothetical protein